MFLFVYFVTGQLYVPHGSPQTEVRGMISVLSVSVGGSKRHSSVGLKK